MFEDRSRAKKKMGERLLALDYQVQSFDSGDEFYWQAYDIAASISVLCLDRGRNHKSLLSQLGIRSTISYISTKRPPNRNEESMETAPPLAAPNASHERLHFVPILDQFKNSKWLSFQDWWDETVFAPRAGKTISRGELCQIMRDKESIAHIDPNNSSASYSLLSKGGDLPFEFQKTESGCLFIADGQPVCGFSNGRAQDGSAFSKLMGRRQPIAGGQYASIRQIAWELITSLEKQGVWQSVLSKF